MTEEQLKVLEAIKAYRLKGYGVQRLLDDVWSIWARTNPNIKAEKSK